ncbi:MAG: hypothetical protein WBO36_08840, partial [Saprospiraceae bacterium]
MNSSQKDIDILHQYLKGMLSEEEKAAVKARLESESQLQSDYQDIKILTQGMRINSLSDKLVMMKGWEEEEDHTQNTKGKKWKWLGLVFLICLAGYLIFHFALKGGSEIPAEYKSLYAERFDDELILHKTKRSAVQAENLSPEQRRAYEMYSMQLFDEAIPLLDDLWKSKSDTLALFYLG